MRVYFSNKSDDYEEVDATASYGDSNGIMYLFDDYNVHPCEAYEAAVLTSKVAYAPGVWFKIVTIEEDDASKADNAHS
jgi:hypothetical protein